MSDLLPTGEDLRRAVRWISERREEQDPPNLARLIDEAALRFDLKPVDQEFLLRFFTRAKSD